MKLSKYPFSQGLPGSMNSVFTPSLPSQCCTARAANAGPLSDRMRLFPSVLNAIAIVQPETIIRWHRKGFRLYWRWKSRAPGGRPKVPVEIRQLIREMSLANRL